MLGILFHPFLKNAIWRLLDTLNFIILLIQDSQLGLSVGVKSVSILSEVWKSDFTEVKTNCSRQGGKLFYFEASEKAVFIERHRKVSFGPGPRCPFSN